MAKTNEELEILNHYGITKFSQVTKDIFLDMQSRLSEMDPEVAKAIIAQIPGYSQYASELVNSVDSTITEAIKSDDAETVLNYEMGNKIIDYFGKELGRTDITPEEKRFLEEKIVEVKKDADTNAAAKRRYHQTLTEIKGGVVVGVLLFICSLFFSGSNSSSRKR